MSIAFYAAGSVTLDARIDDRDVVDAAMVHRRFEQQAHRARQVLAKAGGDILIADHVVQPVTAKQESAAFFRIQVHEMRLDCDKDVVLLKVEQLGHEPANPSIACHTGRHSCFFHRLDAGSWQAVEPVLVDPERIYR